MYYPVSLKISGRLCVVVGGGRVAAQKIKALLRAGARVRIVSPTAGPALKGLDIRHREFRDSDVSGAFLVIAATDDPRVNARVRAACEKRKILVNVVDRPELCTFIAPSTFRRGPLTIAISTQGTAPGLAKTLRRELERIFPPEFGRLVRLIGRTRRRSRGTAARRRISSPGVLALWRRRGIDAVRRELERLTQS
jgi:precorrin-2 dehydrogenase/sirohydrochlorin ferrochelatase